MIFHKLISLANRVRGPYWKLLTEFYPVRLNRREKTRIRNLQYRTDADRENEVSKIFIISLRLIGRAEKQIFKVSGLYGPQNWPVTARVLTERYSKRFYNFLFVSDLFQRTKPFVCFKVVTSGNSRDTYKLEARSNECLLELSLHVTMTVCFMINCFQQSSIVVLEPKFNKEHFWTEQLIPLVANDNLDKSKPFDGFSSSFVHNCNVWS